MSPSNSQKVHLRRSSQRTACGLACGSRTSSSNRGFALRVTDVPDKVTCEACRRSLFMADQEILRRRTGRRR